MITACDNPFAAQRIEALSFQFLRGTWEQQLEQLEHMGWRAAIVGPKGSGKTTLMLELKQWLQREQNHAELPTSIHYCFVGRCNTDRLAQLAALENAQKLNELLLVDGIERFSWRQRRNILRNKSTRLVVTAHRPIGLPIWLCCQTSIELAQSLLRQLVGDPDPWMICECERLYHRHHGNIRDVFRSLYDQLAFGNNAVSNLALPPRFGMSESRNSKSQRGGT